MNLFDKTKLIMKQNNISANKNLGQNFLIDENIVNQIVEASDVGKDDMIIEIGPGLGTLTEKLLEKAGRVVCIELDSKMIGILNKRFSQNKNFELINQDVLKTDLKSLIKNNRINSINKVKVVANLPYYITTPIIMKLLEEKLDIDSITVMVQKEVAERLADKPGGKEASSITCTIWYYSEPKIVLDVPNTSFIPKPEVQSAVVKFDILENARIKVENEELFFKVIKTAFMQKRKTLVNALVNGKIFENREEAVECLEKIGIDEKIRGEKLTLEQYNDICNSLIAKGKNI